MFITQKDAQIMSQSQLQRAIELVDLIGFPETVKTQNEKLLYITDKLTPFLVRRVIRNAEALKSELDAEVMNSKKS